jgi:hypothetical protein
MMESYLHFGYTTHSVEAEFLPSLIESLRGSSLPHKVCDVRMSDQLVGRMVVSFKYFADKGMGADPGIIVTQSWEPTT